MWDIFARAAFTSILAKFGQKGMTLQEIIEKDEEIFNSDIEGHFSEDGIEGLKNKVLEKNRRYFLTDTAGVCRKWAESTIQNALEEKVAKPYDPRRVVQIWGEAIVKDAFNLIETEDNNLTDQKSKDGAFFVEVKTSAYNNGGVIKGKQLTKFDTTVNARRFYAFVFHNTSTKVNMGRTYSTERRLYAALTLQSLYLIPFSIVAAHFDASKKQPYPPDDVYVQLNEKHAKHIFSGDYGIWKISLGLSPAAYSGKELHERVRLITNNRVLESRITKEFNPAVIEKAAKISENESR
ncbi:hypothetical protein GF343_01535 [Candidatus Woesearchaeota archaeon]|nr:hypothetical protein [Candidatus Woesearchaeota archaeon]